MFKRLCLYLVLAAAAAGWAGTPAGAEPREAKEAPLNPAFVKYMKKTEGKTVSPRSQRGRMPSPVNLSHLAGVPVYKAGNGLGSAFPACYDLREKGFVTPVRDQDGYGTCWAFAAMASLESSALKAGAANSDYSEMFLAYYGYIDQSENLVAFGDQSFYDFPEIIMNKGGDDIRAAALLARGTGAVDESDAPYGTKRPDPEAPVSRALRGAYNLYNDGSLSYQKIEENNVKYAIMVHGAVSAGVYASDPMVGAWDESPYFNPVTNAAYIPQDNPDGLTTGDANHAVTLVGWNDAYPRANFNSRHLPPGDGAWIAKNSWGPDWGDGGYFYLSYYDAAADSGTAYVGGDPQEYNAIYQYDPLGWVVNVGYGKDDAWMGNVFTAAEDANIKAAGLYASGVDNLYTVRVYKNAASDPSSGTLALTKNGILREPGYHTIPFDPVPVAKGERFAVAVHLTSPGQNYPIAVEKRLRGYSDRASAGPGEGFISEDGESWSDITTDNPGWETFSVCLKALGTAAVPNGGGCSAGSAPAALWLLAPLFGLIKRH